MHGFALVYFFGILLKTRYVVEIRREKGTINVY